MRKTNILTLSICTIIMSVLTGCMTRQTDLPTKQVKQISSSIKVSGFQYNYDNIHTNQSYSTGSIDGSYGYANIRTTTTSFKSERVHDNIIPYVVDHLEDSGINTRKRCCDFTIHGEVHAQSLFNRNILTSFPIILSLGTLGTYTVDGSCEVSIYNTEGKRIKQIRKDARWSIFSIGIPLHGICVREYKPSYFYKRTITMATIECINETLSYLQQYEKSNKIGIGNAINQ